MSSKPATMPASRIVFTDSLGTAITSLRRWITTSTSAFMPGSSKPSRLETCDSTGNVVTWFCTTACGSILLTSPRKVRSGYASTVISTGNPGFTRPMSISSTRVRTSSTERSAISTNVVPPCTLFTDDWMITPCSTVLLIIVPTLGARTVASSRRSSRSLISA